MIITGIARLGRDATINYTSGGKEVANLSMAFTAGWGDNKGTTWIRGSLWGKRAVSLEPYLTKGQQVYVVLKDLKTSEYNSKTYLEATVDDVQLIGGKSEEKTSYGTTGTSPAQRAAQAKCQQDAQLSEDEDDDLPF